jgi:hypothetical protein
MCGNSHNISEIVKRVYHKFSGQHFEQDHHSLQMADHFPLHREHLFAHLWTFYTIFIQFLHSLHFGREPQLAGLSIAGHIINHSVGDNRWPVMWQFTRQWVTWRYLACASSPPLLHYLPKINVGYFPNNPRIYSTRPTIYACSSWEISLKVRLDVSFDNMQYWNGINEKAREVNSMEAYMRNDETSCRIFNGSYIYLYNFRLVLRCFSATKHSTLAGTCTGFYCCCNEASYCWVSGWK